MPPMHSSLSKNLFRREIRHFYTLNLPPALACQAVAHPKIASSPPAINPIVTIPLRKYHPSTPIENGLFEMPEEAEKHGTRHTRRQEQE